MNNVATKTAAEFDAALAAFVLHLITVATKDYAVRYPNLTAPTFFADKGGKRFVRIVRQDTAGTGKSAVCFVERATGLVWKAASYKAPALNFSRTSVYDFAKVTAHAALGGF